MSNAENSGRAQGTNLTIEEQEEAVTALLTVLAEVIFDYITDLKKIYYKPIIF